MTLVVAKRPVAVDLGRECWPDVLLRLGSFGAGRCKLGRPAWRCDGIRLQGRDADGRGGGADLLRPRRGRAAHGPRAEGLLPLLRPARAGAQGPRPAPAARLHRQAADLRPGAGRAPQGGPAPAAVAGRHARAPAATRSSGARWRRSARRSSPASPSPRPSGPKGALYPPILSASLVAGERSGNLEGVLRRFVPVPAAHQLAEEEGHRRRRLSACCCSR